MSKPSQEPQTLVDRAADAAMAAAELTLGVDGAKVKKMIVLIWAEDLPDGETEDATTSGSGFDDVADLLAEVFAWFSGAAKQAGVTVQLHSLGSDG